MVLCAGSSVFGNICKMATQKGSYCRRCLKDFHSSSSALLNSLRAPMAGLTASLHLAGSRRSYASPLSSPLSFLGKFSACSFVPRNLPFSSLARDWTSLQSGVCGDYNLAGRDTQRKLIVCYLLGFSDWAWQSCEMMIVSSEKVVLRCISPQQQTWGSTWSGCTEAVHKWYWSG